MILFLVAIVSWLLLELFEEKVNERTGKVLRLIEFFSSIGVIITSIAFVISK